MPPAFHTVQEEAVFMQDLLSGLDSSAFDTPPSPDVVRKPPSSNSNGSRAARRVYGTPTKQRHVKVITNSPKSKSKIPNQTIKSKSSHNKESASEDIALLLEGAENWDWDDMKADFLTPKKVKTPSTKQRITDDASLPALVLPSESQSPYRKETCTRCLVKAVKEFIADGEARKELIVNVEPSTEERRIILRDDWTYTDVRQGDVVNVIGTFQLPPSSSTSVPHYTIEVTGKENLLIHHPDILVTATALANAPSCRRKPLLQTLVRSSTEITPALVWGNVLHEVMQTCLKEERWNERFVDEKVEEVVRSNLGELLKIGVTVEQAVREVKTRAGGLRSFAERYIAKKPKEGAVLTNTRALSGQTSLLAITDLLDIEEDIWSPTYGLKGKLDASVAALVEDTQQSHVDNPFSKAKGRIASHRFPFEIKTGRAVAGMEHRAQTMLYTLLMSERYEENVESGLLYYTQSEEVVRVPAARNEIRGLMVTRNEMAEYMMRRMETGGRATVAEEAIVQEAEAVSQDAPGDVEACIPSSRAQEPFLPPTIDDVRACGKCYVVDTCMLYRRAVERVIDKTSPIHDIYDLKTGHLTPSQTEFFRKWESLISMEEQEVVRFRKELWTMGAAEREKKGRCFAEMVLDEKLDTSSLGERGQQGKIHRYTFRFARRNGGTKQDSLLNGHMSSGDAVTVSVEPDLLALARGFILDLSPEALVVGVDHDLSNKSLRLRRQAFTADSKDEGLTVFRIDKDELFGGMSRIRDNLAQMFYPDGDTRRLELVVDLKAPIFKELMGPITSDRDRLVKVVNKLNTNQQEAMRRVLSAQDYALILGMPGTGKTSVVAAIIMVLVNMGKTVLLTSYTHSAVDTILLKLRGRVNFGILRLGNLDKIHPDVHEFTLSARRTAANVEQLEQQVMTPPVIATTCLSIDHPLFLRRKFDYCIIDEASQITLPTCLGPLRYADKFVLVGDHFQLPPLVRNRSARKGGLDVSLFRRLSETHPHAVVDLTEQYRMNEDIMLLSNKLIYGDRLRCGTSEIAKRGLNLPNPEFVRNLHVKSKCSEQRCWIEHLLDERCKAVFVDTDAVPATESRVGDLVQNVTEAALVQQLTECLLRSGISEDQIGIISLYRQQIKLLSYLLQDHQSIEILTADRSQGRDKDCIIISMVRSNESGVIGDLMKDWRRMNVSFTRARSKLVIFGSRKTLKTAPLLHEFFQLMESHNWIITLLPNAHQLHGTPPNTRKRSLTDPGEDNTEDMGSPRQQRKVRKTDATGNALLKGRHILKDLLNESM